jgi:hypothetical protein
MSLASDPDKGLLLETLLLTPCLLTGKTRFDESHASVWITPQDDETILFFRIDVPQEQKEKKFEKKGENRQPMCEFRQQLWGDKKGERICDLIVYYAKGNERVFCFVELKDNLKDLGDATEQITNTYTHFKQHLRLNHRYTAKAFISAPKSSSPPPQRQTYQKALLKLFKEPNNIECCGTANEFGDFLRGVRRPEKKKGKKRR